MRLRYSKAAILIALLKVIFILSCLYYGTQDVDFVSLINSLTNIKLFWLICAFFLQHISIIIGGLRSKKYFSYYGLCLPKIFIIKLYYIGIFFNTFLPSGFGGEGYKVYIISKTLSFSKVKALRVLFYERLSGVLVIAMYSVIAFGYSYFVVYLSDYIALYFGTYNVSYSTCIASLCIVLFYPCYILVTVKIMKDKLESANTSLLYSCCSQICQVLLIVSVVKSLCYNSVDCFSDLKEISSFIFLFMAGTVASTIPISIGGISLREVFFIYALNLIPEVDQQKGIAIITLILSVCMISNASGAFFILGRGFRRH